MSLRSRDISIDASNSIARANKQNQPSKTKLNDSTTTMNETTLKLGKKIEQLEKRLISIENSTCKCSMNINAKLAEFERTMGEKYESIENQVTQHQSLITSVIAPIDSNDSNFHSDFNIDSLRFHINTNDKIADIERTIKEDRCLLEQLHVNQMTEIHQHIKAQEQSMKSCETLIELNATNDTIVQNQFNSIKNKIREIGKTIHIQNKILFQINNIIKRHNNTEKRSAFN